MVENLWFWDHAEIPANGVKYMPNTGNKDLWTFPYLLDETDKDHPMYTLPKDIQAFVTEWGGDAKTYGTVEFKKDLIVKLAKEHPKDVPFGILGIQLHQRHYTHSCYYMLPGRVVTRVEKPGSAVIVDQAPAFIHEVYAEITAGTAIVGPQNIVMTPNVVITDYDGGIGTKPLTNFTDNNAYNPTDDQFGNGEIFYTALPPNYTTSMLPRNLNLHGSVDMLSQYYSPPLEPAANAFPGVEIINAKTQWRTNRTGDPTMRTYELDKRSIPYPVAFVARPMCCLIANKEGMLEYIRPGNGFFKMAGTYTGCRNDRMGNVFQTSPSRYGLKQVP